MGEFVGRVRELRLLDEHLTHVAESRSGRCLMVRGRRRVGKSRLIEEFCASSGVPYVFFTASQQGEREPQLFAHEVATADLPGSDLFAGVGLDSWDAALRLLASALGDAGPAIVVVDEFPYLVGGDPSVEVTFQKQWDRLLSKREVLLVLVGSDLAMMEALNTYGRPFHGRGLEMVVSALSPAETEQIVGSPTAADAFDAYLITGGLPLVCEDWRRGTTMWTYLKRALSNPTSPLIVSGERMLASEFPTEVQARDVLRRIGSGERTFTNIARAGGGMHAAAVNRALTTLGDNRVTARDVPLSAAASKEARYRVADPYLRFWLRFIEPNMADIERGRSDRVIEVIRRDWTSWRGRAIEPIVREALALMPTIGSVASAPVVGGFWTRTNVPEIDVVGADRLAPAKRVLYAGTLKWMERDPLTQADMDKLVVDLGQVPGAGPGTPVIAVSRSGVTGRADATVGPDELLAAFEESH